MQKNSETGQTRDMPATILARLITCYMISIKPYSTTNNILVLLKNWETGQTRDTPAAILVRPITSYMISIKP